MTKTLCENLLHLLNANEGDEATQQIILNVINMYGDLHEFNNYRNGTTDDKKVYTVDFSVHGYKAVTVEAKDRDEASKLADDIIYNTNFGELEEIVCEEIDCSCD